MIDESFLTLDLIALETAKLDESAMKIYLSKKYSIEELIMCSQLSGIAVKKYATKRQLISAIWKAVDIRRRTLKGWVR